MIDWLILTATLPTTPSGLRVRIWRSLKAIGCAPLREGVYLLPETTTTRQGLDFLADYIARELPGVKLEAPIEATYLAWLNVEALGLADPVGHFEKHGVGLSDGFYFGEPRGRHVRLNFGCPRVTLAEALRRMKAALMKG